MFFLSGQQFENFTKTCICNITFKTKKNFLEVRIKNVELLTPQVFTICDVTSVLVNFIIILTVFCIIYFGHHQRSKKCLCLGIQLYHWLPPIT